MDQLTDLLFGDPSVIVASLLAAVLIAAAVILRRRGKPVPPPAVIGAVAVAPPLAGINLDRYAGNPFPHYPAWVVVLAALSLVGFAGSAVRHRHDRPAELALTWAIVAIAIGLYLAVPETGAIRVTLGPLALLAAAATAQWLPPFRAVESTAVVAALAWLAAIDGTSRSTVLLGLTVAVTLAAVVPSVPRSVRPRRLMAPIVTLVAIVVGCRLAGTSGSGAEALLYGGAAVVAVAVTAGLAAATGTRPQSEQLDRTHR